MKKIFFILFLISSHANATETQNPNGGNNMHKSAKSASSGQGIAIAANMAASAALFAASFGPKGPCTHVAMCIMSASAAAQAGLMGGSKGGADDSAAATDNTPIVITTGGPVTPPPPDPYNGNINQFADDLRSRNPKVDLSSGAGLSLAQKYGGMARAKLDQLGFKVDKNGNVTTPGGASVSPGSMGGSGSGLSSSEMEAVKDIQDKIQKSLYANSGVLDGSEGGGGGSRAPSSESGEDPLKDLNFANLFPQKTKEEPKLAGLAKSLSSGDRVGIAEDDIFQMIQRQYIKQDKYGHFLK